MDVLEGPFFHLELTPEEGQELLGLLLLGNQQNVVFMSNKHKGLRSQMKRVKAKHRRLVVIYDRLSEEMRSQGLTVENWREVP